MTDEQKNQEEKKTTGKMSLREVWERMYLDFFPLEDSVKEEKGKKS